MPKGFLVKRAKNSAIYASWRARHNSEEDRTGSDSGSDYEMTTTTITSTTATSIDPNLGSPDSGYSQSPTSLTFGEAVRKMVASADFNLHHNNNNNNNNNLPLAPSKGHVLNLSTIDRQLANVQEQDEKLANLMYCKPYIKTVGNFTKAYVENGNSEPLNLTGHHRRETNYLEERALSPISPAPSPTPPLQAPLLPPVHLPPHSPITIAPMSSFYFPSLDRLTVSSPTSGRHSTYSRVASPASTASNPASPRTLGSNPTSPNKKRNAADDVSQKARTSKKSKAIRKIAFNEDDKSSPISGTIIREPDADDDGAHVVFGDIEPSLNTVEITAEARAEIAKIENRLGDYQCRLCKEIYTDAFGLAQHRCSRIVHVEYRCPECDKVFNCPANLASHRRWHKPRPQAGNKQTKTAGAKLDGDGENRRTPSPIGPAGEDGKFPCETCGKKFRRQAYLRKHIATHSEERQFPCQFCSKPFKSEPARAKHMLQHAFAAKDNVLVPGIGTGGADTTCGICGATFPDPLALDQHGRLHHPPSEAFTCKYCSSSFYSSPGLTRHINKCHPNENPQVILLHAPATRTC